MRINGQVNSQNMTVVSGGSRRLTRVIRILVESGLIYTISVVAFFGTFLASNNAQYGVSDCVSLHLRHPLVLSSTPRLTGRRGPAGRPDHRKLQSYVAR